jgi:hypothetical protein
MLEVEMRNICALGFIGVFLLLGGCATHSATNDEQVDLYLSTLDDKHFVWCEFDLEQCRKDYEKWKLTSRGQMIIREYEKEDTGPTYNTHHLPNVFRTRFLDEDQLAEEVGNYGAGQGVGHQDSDEIGKSFPFNNVNRDAMLEGIHLVPKIYGPEVPSNYGTHTEGSESP